MFNNLESLTDEHLLKRMSDGDEEAFTLLFRRRKAGIYRFAMHMSGSQSIAEDVTQEAFMALIRDPQGYSSEKGTLVGYLYGIARNQVLRRLEKDRFVVLSESGDDEDPLGVNQAYEGDDPLEALTRNETVERVRNAVLALPAHYREVVVLCELQEMSYADTAVALNCAVGTVRSRLHRARAMLIEKLKDTHGANVPSTSAGTARCFA
jgi:RNA polymerase sigma-70 factor (ECF subfamily)